MFSIITPNLSEIQVLYLVHPLFTEIKISCIVIALRYTISTKDRKDVTFISQRKLMFLTQGSMIAAIYVILTFLGASFSYGEIQVRLAEALTILPVFTPAAVPGLFIGCLIGNLLCGCILPDVIFGSLTTLAAALLTYQLRKKSIYLAVLPPILLNTIFVPCILRYGYQIRLPIPWMMMTVGIGELLSCGVLGLFLYQLLAKHRHHIFSRF